MKSTLAQPASKLTLSVDADLIQFAHQYAEQSGQSVSKIFSQYLRSLRQPSSATPQLSPASRRMQGIIKGAAIPASKADIRREYHDRHTAR